METRAQRLNELLDKRRLSLGLRWKDIANRAGVSHHTILQLRKGEPVADLTTAGVERALQWEPGSIARILQDKPPVPKGEADRDPTPLPAEDPARTKFGAELDRLGLDADDPEVREILALRYTSKRRKLVWLAKIADADAEALQAEDDLDERERRTS